MREMLEIWIKYGWTNVTINNPKMKLVWRADSSCFRLIQQLEVYN